MKKIILYELEKPEIQALFSDDGFRIDIEGRESLILRCLNRDIREEISMPGLATDMPSSPAPAEDRPKRKYQRHAGPKRARKTKAAKRSAKPKGKYPCKYGCPESFDSIQEAAAHSRYKHPGKKPPVKPVASPGPAIPALKCPECGRGYQHPKRLQNHREKDHGIKPVAVASKKFTPRQKLAYHGGKAGEPYCSTCDLTFNNNFQLEDHQVDKHGMKIIRSGAMAAHSLAASRGATHG